MSKIETPTYNSSEIRTQNMRSYQETSNRFFDPDFSPDNGKTFPEASLTQQSFKDECDINFIVAKNEATGLINHLNPRQPLQGDFSEFGPATDFMAAQNYLVEARDAFNNLDARVRARFQNDPAKLLDFVSDPDNQDEAIKLGLATRIPETAPQELVLPVKAKKTTTSEASDA